MKFETAKMARPELYDLLGTAIAPLPIALISTVTAEGKFNVAPFSYCCPVSVQPPIVIVGIGTKKGERKATLKNIECTCDFVINGVDEALLEKTIKASGEFPPNSDKIKAVGLTAVPSEMVKAPRIGEAKISLECKLIQESYYKQGDTTRTIVFGEIVLAHVNDAVITDGKIDPRKMRPIGRVGKDIYCRTNDIFTKT